MGNPRVIEAMMQIQSGMEVIRTEAPELARDVWLLHLYIPNEYILELAHFGFIV